MAGKVIELGFVRIWLDEEGIIRMVYSSGATLTIKELRRGPMPRVNSARAKSGPFLWMRGV